MKYVSIIAVAIAVVALALAVAAFGEANQDPAPEQDPRYTEFVTHCDRALDESRAGHNALLEELAELEEGSEEYVAKSAEVDEDAMRDVCGVKVHKAHQNPDQGFADYVSSS